MILTYLLELILNIVIALVNFVNTLFGNNSLSVDVNNFIQAILTITTQAHNFMYFIFGDTLAIVVPITLAMLTTKYLVVPAVQIFRSFFIKGNE